MVLSAPRIAKARTKLLALAGLPEDQFDRSMGHIALPICLGQL